MLKTESGIVARLARQVPSPVAKAIHEAYAHAGLVLAIVSFALSEASKWHAGPAWVAEASGAGLFVIGKFSSARVPATFGDVVRDASEVFPQGDVAAVESVAAEVEKDAPEAAKVIDIVDPGAAAVVDKVEPKVEEVAGEVPQIVAQPDPPSTAVASSPPPPPVAGGFPTA